LIGIPDLKLGVSGKTGMVDGLGESRPERHTWVVQSRKR
jgi:hypothetical protein